MELYLDEFKVNDPANGVYLGDPVEGLNEEIGRASCRERV